MRLEGEVALVTGATAGLGKAIARRLAAEGAEVAVAGRNADRGGAVVESIEAAGGRAVFVAGDLADPAAREGLVTRTVEAFGALTILVNNAVVSSAGRDGPVTQVTPEAWREILEGNLIAAADLCRHAIAAMRQVGHGSIVNVSSRAASRGTPNHAAYAASKGGLEALTRAIAIDHADEGVRCNVVSPGYVINERRDADLGEDRREALRAMHLTRLSQAEDVAAAVAFLAGRDAETITGVVLPVDGGSSTARGKVLG